MIIFLSLDQRCLRREWGNSLFSQRRILPEFAVGVLHFAVGISRPWPAIFWQTSRFIFAGGNLSSSAAILALSGSSPCFYTLLLISFPSLLVMSNASKNSIINEKE
ncbi:unnamed protein product [Linum trigynum]|uniref:Uncharacterized protein n=1 Tax=Linum trigynum TaxID=586398 RepID=A0AAV2GVE0_9ROSI